MATYTATQLGIKPPSGGFENLGWYPGAQGGSYQYLEGTFGETGVIHPNSPQQGAGQKTSPEIRAQSAAQQGVTYENLNEFIERPVQGGGGDLNLQSYLDGYQGLVLDSLGEGSGLPSVRGGTAGTGGGIDFEAIRSQLTGGVQQPDEFSRVQEFERLREQYGVSSLEQQLNDLKAQQREAEAQLRVNTTAERGKPVAQNVIEARVGEQTRQARETIDYLSRQQAYLTDQLNSAYSIINTYIQLQGADYQDAVDRYNTSFNQNLQVIDLVRGLQKDQISEEQRRIDNAQANLTTLVNAATKGNLSVGNMSADQLLTIRKLEAQAGLPSGFVEQLQLSGGDKLVTINKETGEALMRNADGSFRVVKTGLTPTGGGAGTAGEREQKLIGKYGQYLEQNKTFKGYVHPDVWQQALSAWVQDGLKPEDFYNRFRQYTDPRYDEASFREKYGEDAFKNNYGFPIEYRTTGDFSNYFELQSST